jgi:spermidine synthase
MSEKTKTLSGAPESLVLCLSMFVMGGCGLAYEYTFSRVASDLLGNSTRQWAIIIGVMLFFMGVGADVQKYLTDRRLVDKLILSEIALALLGGFGPLAMLFAYGQFREHYVLVQYFFICSIGLLIGLEIPLITRINETYSRELRFNLASVLKMDYIGSLCGALCWIFILPRFFTMVEMAFVLAFFSVGVAAFTLFYFRSLVHHRLALFITISLCAGGLAYSFSQSVGWAQYAEQFLFRDRIIFSKTTDYQHIVLTKSSSGEISCYINGHLQFNAEDEYIYHENLVHPAMSIAPRKDRVLILGGGDGLALREVLKYPEVKEVVLVDIDPAMTALAAKNSYFVQINKGGLNHAKVHVIENHALAEVGREELFIPNQKAGFHGMEKKIADIKILNIDAAKFVDQAAGKYDVIIMDFPDPNSMELAKLYAQHFYGHVKKRLAVSGILVQQSTSPIHAKEAFLCIGRTLAASGFSVVPFHDNVPSFGEWGWWIGGHGEVRSPEKIHNSLVELSKIPVETRYLTSELVHASLVFGKGQLETDNTDITTLSSSRAHHYYLMGWRSSL